MTGDPGFSNTAATVESNLETRTRACLTCAPGESGLGIHKARRSPLSQNTGGVNLGSVNWNAFQAKHACADCTRPGPPRTDKVATGFRGVHTIPNHNVDEQQAKPEFCAQYPDRAIPATWRLDQNR